MERNDLRLRDITRSQSRKENGVYMFPVCLACFVFGGIENLVFSIVILEFCLHLKM